MTLKGIVIAVGGLALIIGVAMSFVPDDYKAHSHQERMQVSSYEPQSPQLVEESTAAIHLPQSETDFISLVHNAASAYEAAPNELKKSSVKASFTQAVLRAVPGNLAVNWIGKIRALHTTGEGDAIVEIEISDDITIETNNNSLSDNLADFRGKGHTLIRNGTELYNKVGNLKEGENVVFSARFLDIGNLTEEGSVTSPEMISRFSAIDRTN